MRLYISNAFSLSMLDPEVQKAGPSGMILNGRMVTARTPRRIEGDPRDWIEAAHEVVSILGHAATQRIFERELGISVPVNRQSIRLGQDDFLLVGQYIGPRLSEGTTELPEGARIEWWGI